MKYENFAQCEDIVKKINTHRSKLSELAFPNVHVAIRNNNGTIFTIGVDSESEHEYSKVAQFLVKAITNDLELRITNLKKELADL